MLLFRAKKERSDLGIMFDKKNKKRREFYGNIIDVGLPAFTDRKMKDYQKQNRVEPQGKIVRFIECFLTPHGFSKKFLKTQAILDRYIKVLQLDKLQEN